MEEKKEQVIKIGDEKVNGFRDGMTKKKLLQTMTDEDWLRIDKMKEAEERLVKSKTAYDLYIASDQMRAQFEENANAVDRAVAEVLELNRRIYHNNVAIKSEKIDQKTEDGYMAKPEDLKVRNLLYENMINKQLRMLRTFCSGLYSYVDKKGLDKKPFFTEADYEKKIQDVISKLSETKYKLIE